MKQGLACGFCLVLSWAFVAMHELHLRARLHQDADASGGYGAPPTRVHAQVWELGSSPGLRANTSLATAQGQQPSSSSGRRVAKEATLGAAEAVSASSGSEKCKSGAWRLTLHVDETKVKCNLRSREGSPLCDGGRMVVIVRMDNCTAFHVVKVGSCSPQDYKCAHYNCKRLGVWRLETSRGDVVDVGTADKMLMCGNAEFKLESVAFCREGAQACIDQATSATPTRPCTTTTAATIRPALSDVILKVSPFAPDLSLQRCALVGASSSLLNQGLGEEIDGHDTVIRINRLPITKYVPDFGGKTDVFFAHDKNVQASGFSLQYMDGEWKHCGNVPNRSHCHQIQAFIWNNVWRDQWVEKHRAALRDTRADSIFIGATALKTGCIANILLNRHVQYPQHWEKTRWRWMSTGFSAFLTFGYLCKSLRIYGFSGLGSADSDHGTEARAVEIHNYTKEHEIMDMLVSGTLGAIQHNAGGDACGREGEMWLKKHLAWFSEKGRIQVIGQRTGSLRS